MENILYINAQLSCAYTRRHVLHGRQEICGPEVRTGCTHVSCAMPLTRAVPAQLRIRPHRRYIDEEEYPSYRALAVHVEKDMVEIECHRRSDVVVVPPQLELAAVDATHETMYVYVHMRM